MHPESSKKIRQIVNPALPPQHPARVSVAPVVTFGFEQILQPKAPGNASQYDPVSEAENCTIREGIDLLQEKWVLHIVRTLLDGPRGFNELSVAVGGVNPTTLVKRLTLLETRGILTRTVESTMPPKTRYELTDVGRELESVVEAISSWASRIQPAPTRDAYS